MNASEALESSILHWQENVAAERPGDVNLGPDDCALCKEYHASGCGGCPVAVKVNNILCRQTPYKMADLAFDDWEECPTPETAAAWRKAAQAMTDFLISLREPKP